MKKFLKKIFNAPFLVIVSCLILFLPGFITYFSQDDFIHLSYSQTFREVIESFNLFHKGDFPFYRPIPTQVFFFYNRLIFDFNPLGFHIVNFLIFSLNIIFAYKLIKLMSSSNKIAALSVIFFGINSTHFAPLYSPAYVHELFYVLFGILSVYTFVHWLKKSDDKYYLFSMIFFILALMSKETAVILPFVLFIIYIFLYKKEHSQRILKTFFIPFIILMVYLIGHFFFYGLASNSSYQVVIGKKNINILIWYFLWALSTPNILIDFIGPGIRINSVFFQVARFQGTLYFWFFPMLAVIGLFLLFKLISQWITGINMNILRLIILGLSWFVVGMIPLVVFPLHKLATEQAFSLVGLSLGISTLLNHFLNYKKAIYKLISILFIAIYLVIAVNSIFLARKTHWIVKSAKQAKNIIDFIKFNYPDLKDNDTIYFRSGQIKIAPYGSSKQIYYATGNGAGIKLILNKPNLNLYFEEINPLPKSLYTSKEIITIDSSKFLGY